MTGEIPPGLPPMQSSFGQPPAEQLLAEQFQAKIDGFTESLEQLTYEKAVERRYLEKLSQEIQDLYGIANQASGLEGA